MGVYADRTADPFDDPKVETITSLVKRRHGMAVGIVTNTEIEDATPAAMIAHTRRRATYRPDRRAVLCGEARGADGRRLGEFPAAGRARRAAEGQTRITSGNSATPATPWPRPRPEMTAAAKASGTTRLLGLFHTGNMDGALDRKFLKGGTVKRFPEQPDLTEQVQAALDVLSRNRQGLLPDGRVRDDRQIHPCARHGARGLRHDHARQRGEACEATGPGRAATTR